MKTLTFKTVAQKILFTNELAGQISDGNWENASPHNHWEAWNECEVLVGDNVGRNFSVRKDNYNFCNKELLGCVGDRMIKMVRVKLAFPDISDDMAERLGEYCFNDLRESMKKEEEPGYWTKQYNKAVEAIGSENIEKFQKCVNDESLYSEKDLKNDLKEMKKIIKIEV